METITETIERHLAALNSTHTRSAYRTPLKLFCTYLAGLGIRPEQASADALTVDHAIDFVPYLRRRALARATMQLYLTAVYRYYRSLLLIGAELSAPDMARLEETYRIARDIRGEERPREHTLSAAQAVVSTARARATNSGLEPLRNLAIVETLRSTGCRVGELVGLRIEDVAEQGQSALVRGKGSKWRSIYWDNQAWASVVGYLQKRGLTHPDAVRENPPLFVGHGSRSGGAPLTTRHVSRIVRELARTAGVPDVTPHYFRHVFATRALDRTGQLALVQDLLGHASPNTTRVYARTNDEQRQAAHRRVWS